MPTALTRVYQSPSTGVDKPISCPRAYGGKKILSANHARCCAANLISPKDAIAASIACHAAKLCGKQEFAQCHNRLLGRSFDDPAPLGVRLSAGIKGIF
jgi:hypothetical protein